ncbi:hypothetical protein [Methylorubrum aminovorans]
MTRPIHAHLAVAAQPRLVPVEAPADVAEENPADAVAPATADTDVDLLAPSQPEADAGEADLTRLRLEVAMMKAALAAERRESEALRSSLGLVEAETLSEEARAVRARWAALVERLIHDPL